MKTHPLSGCPDRINKRAAGFTILELLVSVAVLSIMVVLLAQALGGVSAGWSAARERMDNFAKARAIIGLMAEDIERGIFRHDLACFVDSNGDTAFQFLTQRVGMSITSSSAARSDSDRQLSHVFYQIDPQDYQIDPQDRNGLTLVRRTRGVSFAGSTPLPFIDPGEMIGELGVPLEWQMSIRANAEEGTDGGDPEFVSEGVVGFSFAFVQKDGSVSADFQRWQTDQAGSTHFISSETTAIQVSIAVLSERALNAAVASGTLADIIDSLRVAATPPSTTSSLSWSAKREWERLLREGNLGGNPAVTSGIRFYERVIPVPVNYYRFVQRVN